MVCVTSTRQKQRSALLTFTLFALVLTQIFLSACAGALSAENKERQNNEIQSRSNCGI
jgi:hypothetical protein